MINIWLSQFLAFKKTRIKIIHKRNNIILFKNSTINISYVLSIKIEDNE